MTSTLFYPATANQTASLPRKQADFEAPWFHGHISRDEAEKRLINKPDGAFLVRESTNFPGDHTLCLGYNGKIEHYRIARKDGQYTCDDEEFFDALNDLIAHYKLDADGLCHHLTLAVPAPCPSDRTANKIREPRIGVDNSVDLTATAAPSCADFGDWSRRLKEAGYAIKRRDLRLGDTIGRGEFGDVLVGWLNEQKVAVKALKEATHIVGSFLQEAVLMASLKHANLVQLLGVVLDDPTDLFIVVEYMTNGNLVDYLRSRGRQQVTAKQQFNFACDTCAGMAYLESRNLVHRDLAARNVLLSEDMVAKVSDFGLAKKVDLNLPEDASGKFPIKWTAPEALRYTKFTNKSDVWSYGVFLWEIYSFGRVPYPRIPVQDVIKHVEKGYRMEAPDGCPSDLSHTMHECWEIDPNKRPTFKELLSRLQIMGPEKFK